MAYWFCKAADYADIPLLGDIRLWFCLILAADASLWTVFKFCGRRLFFDRRCCILLSAGLVIFFGGFCRMVSAGERSALELYLQEAAPQAVTEGRIHGMSVKEGNATLILKSPSVVVKGQLYHAPAVMVWVKKETFEGLHIRPDTGMTVRVRGGLKLFEGPRNPGEFDYALYYRGQKLAFRSFADELEVLDASRPVWQKRVSDFENFLSRALQLLCTGDDRGVYEAVLAGDKSELSEEIRLLYQKNGIAHLLAVSGLHVSLIGMGLYRLLRRFSLGFGRSGALSAGLLLFYGCVTGFGPSVSRALLMVFCTFLALYLGRTYDLLSALSLSLLLLAFDSPYLLFTAALQLSFGAVLSIGIGTELLKRWEKGQQEKKDRRSAFMKNVQISVLLQLFTAPVLLYHFFEYPVYGIFLNLLVIPLMTYVVASGIGAVAVYGFWELTGVRALFSAALGIMGTGHFVLLFYELLCRAFSRLPFYSCIIGRPSFPKILIYYGGLLLAALYPGGEGRRGRLRFFLAGGAAALFLSITPVTELKVTFLDVGQGDGIVLQAPDCNVLVDGGSSQVKELGKQRLVPFLKSRGMGRLNFVFVSHGDGDHISGIRYLLEEQEDIVIDNLVFSAAGREDEACQALAEAAKSRGTKLHYMEAGQRLTAGALSLTALHPGPQEKGGDKNEASLVLLAAYGEITFLLTGDVEDEGEAAILSAGEQWLPSRVTVLKAAHHGSKSSSGAAFLDRVRPEHAVLSYGEGNSYGHPSPEVAARLEARGARLWRTGWSGAIEMTTDGKRLRIKEMTAGGQNR